MYPLTLFKGEVLQRQGWWVRIFTTLEDADNWVLDRMEADNKSVNPIRDNRCTPIPLRTAARWGTSRAEDGVCPECGNPVAASVGIHFDCRGAAQ